MVQNERLAELVPNMKGNEQAFKLMVAIDLKLFTYREGDKPC